MGIFPYMLCFDLVFLDDKGGSHVDLSVDNVTSRENIRGSLKTEYRCITCNQHLYATGATERCWCWIGRFPYLIDRLPHGVAESIVTAEASALPAKAGTNTDTATSYHPVIAGSVTDVVSSFLKKHAMPVIITPSVTCMRLGRAI